MEKKKNNFYKINNKINKEEIEILEHKDKNNIYDLGNEQINNDKLEDVLDKMEKNINKMKIHKPKNEKLINNNSKNIDNNYIKTNNIINKIFTNNNINLNNNIINNDGNKIIINLINNNDNNTFFNNDNINDFPKADNIKRDNENKSNYSLKDKSIGNETNKESEDNKNDVIIDKNLNISENIKINQELKNIKLQNQPEQRINILQNLKGISNQNINDGSTLMSNVSYSSFLSFKNKRVKFVNLNSSINQSLMNKSKKEELKKQEEIDKEKINQKEKEKTMKIILERLGGGNEIIHENEYEEGSIKKINNESNQNVKEDSSSSESLLFKISKKYEINKKNKENNDINPNDIYNYPESTENTIKINCIKCTLSFLDKGKAIFVSENDDIFSLPSAVLNQNIQVGNSYLFQIEKVNNFMKKFKGIEILQNKYKEWK